MIHDQTSRRVFVQDGKPVGVIGGTDSRYRQENGALVVMPDERWGNPLFAAACLDENDFHIHARITLDELAGTGASVLLGGHYHYCHSRPDGNMTFRISLDEDIHPANQSLAKPMRIVHGRTNPRRHWSLEVNLPEKEVVGLSSDHITPGKPFTIDIYRRGENLSFEINNQEVFHIDMSQGDRVSVGRCGDSGWPINFGFLPGHGVMRIHDFHATGRFPEPLFPTTDVWHFNTHGYLHYRIPSICMMPSGRLLAFTEARHARLSRSREWENDWVQDEIHCLMKVSDDNGQTWSEPRTIIDYGVSYEARSPAPLLDRDTGELFLFTGLYGPWVVSSTDEGKSWSQPRSLADATPAQFTNFRPGVGNCMIQLRHGPNQGRLLLTMDSPDNVGVIYSDDHGRTWQPGAVAAFAGSCEPSIVELSDGQVLVVPRNRPPNGSKPPGRLIFTSPDGGVTFSEHRYEMGIPIPGQGEMISVEPSDGQPERALVFCGPAQDKTRLTMIVSLDDGKTWPISKMIDDGAAANLALVALPEGHVGVLYERDKYLRLCFQRVDLNALINQGSNVE